ncbi:protein FdhE [Shewanella sp. NFH-SH190041]|uniref:formate dehydrogenase accessory protein FdhE n=1 Tax=Shewanella sp. NFH-SH190041 TaxID=2950245 RepID=UPI0021C332DA|nr:formate dehydrogenase accessory protein FdhE [Shewanella sp. NFH-SH190041]BDM63206.1 protein FdhE [Shewanella sp. NFH-SH190041]
MTEASSQAGQLNPPSLAIVSVIAADPAKLYRRRAQRIAAVKQDSQIADYLLMLEQLVLTQADIAANGEFGPVPEYTPGEEMPFSLAHFGEDRCWQGVLLELIAGLQPRVSTEVADVLSRLGREDGAQLQQWAAALRNGKFSAVPGEYSLFIWAALSLYWSHWAPMVIPSLKVELMAHKELCPVCGSHPVASVVVDKPRKGLRYLHCSMCESQWHLVRANCTRCHEDDGIYLWAEQEKDAAVRIESCDHCKGYTKMMFTDLHPDLDAPVDDLLTLHYDQYLAEQGFKPTTVNPFLLVHEDAE